MIKRAVVLGFLLFGLVAQVHAGAGVLFGISYNFGVPAVTWENLGVTGKILSDDDANTGVLAAGGSFYPFAKENKFGVDISAGYLFKNGAATVGWDFLQRKPQVAIGYVDTKDDATPTPTPTPPPTPTPTDQEQPVDEGPT